MRRRIYTTNWAWSHQRLGRSGGFQMLGFGRLLIFDLIKSIDDERLSELSLMPRAPPSCPIGSSRWDTVYLHNPLRSSALQSTYLGIY